MKEDKFHRWIKKEIEEEAEALEKHAQENEELASLRMPDDSYEDLMRRIAAREKENAGKTAEKASGAGGAKVFRFRRRTLIAAALAAVLLLAFSAGAVGERLFEPEVTGQIEDGEYNVTIISGDEEIYKDVTEEEAYNEIEERLGILALRLGYKPQGMELEKVYIDENMGEAQMELHYNDFILRIYENKQNAESIFETQFDGEIIGSIDAFYYGKPLEVLEINIDKNESFYATQMEQGNSYYNVASNINLNEFELIVQELFFKSV